MRYKKEFWGMLMKKESLFLLFIVIPLCATDSKKDQGRGQKRGQLTHVINVCYGEAVGGEILCMYPKGPLSNEEKKLRRKLRELSLGIGSVGQEYYFEGYDKCDKKYKELEELLKQECEDQNKKYLSGLSNDDVLKHGLVCKVKGYLYRIFTQKKKCLELVGTTRFNQMDWPPKYAVNGLPGENSAICYTRYTPKKIEFEKNNLIIKKSDGQKVEVSLSVLPKKTRSMISATTYGHKEGDRMAILCSTGEVFILAHKKENHGKPTIIYGDEYKREVNFNRHGRFSAPPLFVGTCMLLGLYCEGAANGYSGSGLLSKRTLVILLGITAGLVSIPPMAVEFYNWWSEEKDR